LSISNLQFFLPGHRVTTNEQIDSGATQLDDSPQWHPYRESRRATLLRTISIAVGVGALALLVILLPRWRRRARNTPSPAHAGPAISAADAARLDEELRAFDR